MKSQHGSFLNVNFHWKEAFITTAIIFVFTISVNQITIRNFLRKRPGKKTLRCDNILAWICRVWCIITLGFTMRPHLWDFFQKTATIFYFSQVQKRRKRGSYVCRWLFNASKYGIHQGDQMLQQAGNVFSPQQAVTGKTQRQESASTNFVLPFFFFAKRTKRSRLANADVENIAQSWFKTMCDG